MSELLISGGRVETATGAPAEAVGIQGDRIIAVGAREEVAAALTTRARRVELNGESVLPGFGDAHVHPVDGGLLAAECDLHAIEGAEAYLEAIGTYAAAHPDREWITGGGWSMPAFPAGCPRREALDARVSHRPVYLENRDGHGAWVNSRALELAGIGPETPDPPDGRIERDADGTPSGTLHEGAALLVRRLLPAPTEDDLVAAIQAGQAHLHALGITGWVDASVRPERLSAYRRAAAEGRLTARVMASQLWEPAMGLEEVAAILARAGEVVEPNLRADSVKVFLDGVVENYTALLLGPYLDGSGQPSANRGLQLVEPELLGRLVTALDAASIGVHFHAIGDGAVRQALDAVATARAANGPRDARHHIAHLQLVHPDDRPRFAQLNVTATIQPYWACWEPQMTDLTVPFIGPERSGWQYPFASLTRAGARLAGGSDWTVSTANPLLEIEVAVRRISPDERDAEPFLPHERLPLDVALEAFTRGSAYVARRDAETGTIEPGKLADLVILDRDLRRTDATGEARVLHTLVGGRDVYSAALAV